MIIPPKSDIIRRLKVFCRKDRAKPNTIVLKTITNQDTIKTTYTDSDSKYEKELIGVPLGMMFYDNYFYPSIYSKYLELTS